MINILRAVLTFCLPVLLIFFTSCVTKKESRIPEYDLLIYNAQIFDGTGNPSYTGAVGISGNKIIKVYSDQPDTSRARAILNAQNKVLSPGFIDLHAHGNPDDTPDFENFIAMGVTTISLGQDGGSPDLDEIRNLSSKYKDNGLGPNLVMFYGHGTLREAAGTGQTTYPDSVQRLRMDSLLSAAFTYTFGLSLGLEYSPGMYANLDELQELATITGNHNKMIMSHIRNEDDDSLHQSVREMLSLGEFCQVHIAHLKSVFGKGAERADEILEWLHDGSEAGIQITADIYPYTASYTGIAILFPDWAKTEEQFEKIRVSRRKELEEFLYKKVMSRNGPGATLIGTGEFAGMTLEEAASRENVSFTDLLIDKIGPQGASGAYFVMDEELQTRLMQDPLVAVCSDGSPSGYHPRGHGTFARIIEEYTLARNSFPMETAIYKMTGFPAEILGLTDRGVIREGMKADLILFDPREVHETARFDNPFQLAEGFEFVLVNGQWMRYEGRITDSLAGHYIMPEKK